MAVNQTHSQYERQAATLPVEALSSLKLAQSTVREELLKPLPDLAKVSIVLGAIEGPLTVKDTKHQRWPLDLQADIAEASQHLERFLVEAQAHLQKNDCSNTRAKVKAVADLIWSKLTGVFAKDILHAQSVWAFARVLAAGKGKGKRQLDCAGVVTTTLAVCQRLAQDPQHADLAACRFQVSEDHCWLTLAEDGSREASVEVTTDAAAKRGLPADASAWDGWLYNGGHATVCSPQICVAALVASINPSIVARQNTGTDAEGVQLLQESLLRQIHTEHPEAMYPAASCALGDLCEIWGQEDLETALAAGDAVSLAQQLASTEAATMDLFRQAICQSSLPEGATGFLWYPYGYAVGFLARRAQFLLQPDVQQLVGSEAAWNRAAAAMQQMLTWCGAGAGAGVLRHYVMTPTDDQLLQDVEGVLELCCEAPRQLQQPPFPLTVSASANHSTSSAAPQPHPAQGAGAKSDASSIPQETLPSNANSLGQPRDGKHLNGFARESCLTADVPSQPGFPAAVSSAVAQHGQADAALAAPAEPRPHDSCQAVAHTLGEVQAGSLHQNGGCHDHSHQQDGAVGGTAAAGSASMSEAGWEAGNGQLGCRWLVGCLELWDGACWLMRGRAKPTHWLAALLKAAKCFPPAVRAEAASIAQVTSEPMQQAQQLWEALKPQAIKPIFESADVQPAAARETKRRRL